MPSPLLLVLLRERASPEGVGVGVGKLSLSLPLPLSHAARTSNSILTLSITSKLIRAQNRLHLPPLLTHTHPSPHHPQPLTLLPCPPRTSIASSHTTPSSEKPLYQQGSNDGSAWRTAEEERSGSGLN